YRRHAVGALQVGNGLAARADAVEKVPGVQLELFARAAGFVLLGLRPRFDRVGLLDALRPADGVGPGELRHGVLRGDLAVAGQDEAGARDRQAAARAAQFQSGRRLAGAGFAVRPEGREAGVLDQGVLRVGRLAVVLQAEATADAGHGRRTLDVEE